MVTVYIADISSADNVNEEYCRLHFPKRFEKSKRFVREEDRKRSIGAGILVHEILGADEDSVTVNEYGKPYIKGGKEFSVSHSGNFAVLAVNEFPVGVDIELIDRNMLGAIKRMATEDELAWLDGQPESKAFDLWTLKESVTKSVGLGFSLPFDSFDVLPLTDGGKVSVCGREIYGKILNTVNGYSLSVCTEDFSGNVRTELFYL